MRVAVLFGFVGLAAFAQGVKGPVPIILISVDTLRADHVSAYSPRARSTPNIDFLTNGGTLFAQATAQVPLTLPSHASLLTSTYPFVSGIQDNGQLVPAGSTTLASVLKSRGYRTAAFVGGFVLDRRFGLNQGFDVYSSPFPPSAQDDSDAADLKRLGKDVTQSATEWIQKNSGSPFFVFLHLFDLHTPDNLPKAIRSRFPGPRYTAELGYIDEVLGEFWTSLGQFGILDKALIVFLSDHGESLGEHGENTHGYFIYQSTTSVPLIFHWPAGSPPTAARIAEPVSLMGVAPTILQFLKIPMPVSFQGRSLLGLTTGGSPEPQQIYSESLYSYHHFNTSGLSSLRYGKFKFIQAPKPELYDLQADPDERTNLYAIQTATAKGLSQRLNALRRRYGPTRPQSRNAASPEVVARLRSLGYLGGGESASGSIQSGADPKDRIADYSRYRRALTQASSGSLRESNAELNKLLSTHPDLFDARNMLALNQQRLGEHDAAVKNLREVLKHNPRNAAAHLNIATSYSRLKRLDEALGEAQAAVAIASQEGSAGEHIVIPAREMVGAIWVQKTQYEKARTEYSTLLSFAPNNYEAHYNLAWIDAREGHADASFVHLQAAVKSDPTNAVGRNALGSVYLQKKNFQSAQKEFSEAVRLDPKFVFARYNLGLVLQLQGATEEAVKQFREALKLDPKFQPAHTALAQLGAN